MQVQVQEDLKGVGGGKKEDESDQYEGSITFFFFKKKKFLKGGRDVRGQRSFQKTQNYSDGPRSCYI